MFQRPTTKDCDIPHRTSVAKAVHAKAQKVRDTLKELFAVSLFFFFSLALKPQAHTSTLEHPWRSVSNLGWLVVISP
jgi:hypothetical protein